MEKYKLNAQKRTVIGRKVKNLRQKGLLPANIYGKKVKSEAVTVNLKDFQKIYAKAGETGIVELKVEKEEKERPVLIHNLQLHPVTDTPLHADFYQISLKEKIKATVPVVVTGQSPAVFNKEGLLMTILNEIEVECLPTDLPEKIEVDASRLTKVDEEIKVADLAVDRTKVTVLTNSGLVVCKISSLITEEVKKEMEAEAAAKAAAEAEKAAAAGAPAGEAAPAAGVKTPVSQAKTPEKPVAKPEEKKKPTPEKGKK